MNSDTDLSINVNMMNSSIKIIASCVLYSLYVFKCDNNLFSLSINLVNDLNYKHIQ